MPGILQCEGDLKMENVKENLKRLFINALIKLPKFQLAFRPSGVKFEENASIVQLHIDSTDCYGGFSIGDICMLKKNCAWYTGGPFRAAKANLGGNTNAYRIVAFVELTGHLRRGVGIRFRDKFCVLAGVFALSSYFIEKADERPNAPVLLFWVGGLQKIEQK